MLVRYAGNLSGGNEETTGTNNNSLRVLTITWEVR